MYTQFFGLREKPFSITPDPRYLYMSQRHADALAHLIYGISQSGGFIQLTGEVGTGKTTLVRSLFEKLPDEADVALILNPELTTHDFLTAISEELGAAPPADKSMKALVDELNTYLLEAHARGRRTVLIVDEAQNLGTDVLEQVRLLTNLETPKQKLLQIILIGQPELREVLSRDDMRQLAQRVTGRYHLEPLSQEDTSKYLEHRMKVAGATGTIFQPAAIREIYRRSKGVPRLINVIADRSLLAAYTQETRKVDKPLVRRAAEEVYGDRLVPYWQWRVAGVTAMAGIALLALGVWRTLGPSPPQTTPPAIAAVPTQLTALAEPARIAAIPAEAPAELPVEMPAEISAEIPAEVPAEALIEESPATSLANLFADPSLQKDTDSAFQTLFDLWGAQYQAGSGAACLQAEEQNLRCWFHKGSISHVRRLNRPGIFSLTDDNGSQYQIVVSSLQTDTATLAVGNQTYDVALNELSRYWYGDQLMLWKPNTSVGDDLAPGTAGPGVRWLRDSLARIQGDYGGTVISEFYDAGLEERVREYQRQRRLTVDGIVGAQTQIAINTDLASPDTPLLSRADH